MRLLRVHVEQVASATLEDEAVAHMFPGRDLPGAQRWQVQLRWHQRVAEQDWHRDETTTHATLAEALAYVDSCSAERTEQVLAKGAGLAHRAVRL